MISLTTAELDAWIAAYFFPLARILALLAVAPPFNNAALPRRVRLILGLAVTLAIVPALGRMPAVAPASGGGLLILAEQLLIGFAMGFAMRIAFAAVDLAGNIFSYQMGLGFATSYDPQATSQTPVMAEFLGLLALLVFLAIDAHLMVLSTLVQSFAALPVGTLPASASWMNVANSAAVIFSSGLLLALPIIVALLITNVALGVLGRVAPQLNLMVVGFPTTIALGFVTLYVVLPYLSPPLLRLFESGLQAMLGNLAVVR